ncbi:hypothetical protein [Holophaga foetida]|uniref:hypothetical protein n=1 Tax=Holophaga foetida TaxID=35839 RepID=UPI0002471C47|nr:hypothetical protein [Holophaga foetida]
MNESLAWTFRCLTLLGLGPGACLAEMEANGIPQRTALEVILSSSPGEARSSALGKAKCGARLAQARPELFGVLAELLESEGIHPLSMLNWEGWKPDLALSLLQSHWRGPGRPPLPLIDQGCVPCAGLRMLPRGLRLQRLRLARCPDLRWLPEGLEIQDGLECRGLGLRQMPANLNCGGDVLLADLPLLEGWGEGIRIGGDLVLKSIPRRAAPPVNLCLGGTLRLPHGWAPVGWTGRILGWWGSQVASRTG